MAAVITVSLSSESCGENVFGLGFLSEMKTQIQHKSQGKKILIVALYAVLSMAAIGRSTIQIVRSAPEIPIAYWLSAIAAVVYVIATISLFIDGRIGRKIAWVSISFELLGVLIVGTISLAAPQLLGQEHTDIMGAGATVWTGFGLGYVLIPLVLPIIGLLWLYRAEQRERLSAQVPSAQEEM